MRALALSLCLWPIAFAAYAAEAGAWRPDDLYRALARDAYVRQLEVVGDVDLARLRGPAGAREIRLRNVVLRGRLYNSGNGPALPLAIDGESQIERIDLTRTRLRAGLVIDNSTLIGLAHFDHAQFDGPFVLRASVVKGGAVFRGAQFNGPVEIVDSTFEEPQGLRGGISFADAHFASTARFDRSRFAGSVRFDGSRFGDDVAFRRLVVSGDASWRAVTFAGDAEFRFCELGAVDFGDADQMSVFGKLGDFRGCKMKSAKFDYIDWRGDAMLVNLDVSGDLSLRNALLRGARSDWSGLRVGGAFLLEGTQVVALRLRWFDLEKALMRQPADKATQLAEPDIATLRMLHRQLLTLKQDDEAVEVGALIADRSLRERVARPDTPLLERPVLWLEQWLWGWATGYGTRLGRIGALMVAAWLLLSLPLLVGRVPIGHWTGPADDAPPRHRGAPASQLTQLPQENRIGGLARRLEFVFGLMYALPGWRLRAQAPLSGAVAIYLALLRAVGAVLLALGALTLAHVSPVLQALVGKVAF